MPKFTIEPEEDGKLSEFHIESHLPKGWWKYPTFDFTGIHMPAPYIWFAYWLITWDYTWGKKGEDWWQFLWWRIPKISISFMPD